MHLRPLQGEFRAHGESEATDCQDLQLTAVRHGDTFHGLTIDEHARHWTGDT